MSKATCKCFENLSIDGHPRFWPDRLKIEDWHSETVLVGTK